MQSSSSDPEHDWGVPDLNFLVLEEAGSGQTAFHLPNSTSSGLRRKIYVNGQTDIPFDTQKTNISLLVHSNYFSSRILIPNLFIYRPKIITHKV